MIQEMDLEFIINFQHVLISVAMQVDLAVDLAVVQEVVQEVDLAVVQEVDLAVDLAVVQEADLVMKPHLIASIIRVLILVMGLVFTKASVIVNLIVVIPFQNHGTVLTEIVSILEMEQALIHPCKIV